MKSEKALLAGGCFWCIQATFDKVPGVLKTVAGYTGGARPYPSYEEVSQGESGHQEAVEITFDPEKITYDGILNIFWRAIDPTDGGGQFADRGSQYHTAIFYYTQEQKQSAEDSKELIKKFFGKPIVTRILEAHEFFPAEEYHQEYHLKNAQAYKSYAEGSGRESFLKNQWHQVAHSSCTIPSLQGKLSTLQYEITQKDGTETPFDNAYWNNERDGIYVDVVSGEPLFSSVDKYDSGTGWPSFTKPLIQENIVKKSDTSLGMERTEVRSGSANSHLGHLFQDGPQSTGERYCINSAALRFIPKEDLEKEGYAQFINLFIK